MTVPDSLNARIALAKGWTWHKETLLYEVRTGSYKDHPSLIVTETGQTHWKDATGIARRLPDWVGTLAGVAELMRELEHEATIQHGDCWNLTYNWPMQQWEYWRYGADHNVETYTSPDDRPGDCVADAWLSVFGKESDG